MSISQWRVNLALHGTALILIMGQSEEFYIYIFDKLTVSMARQSFQFNPSLDLGGWGCNHQKTVFPKIYQIVLPWKILVLNQMQMVNGNKRFQANFIHTKEVLIVKYGYSCHQFLTTPDDMSCSTLGLNGMQNQMKYCLQIIWFNEAWNWPTKNPASFFLFLFAHPILQNQMT